jgi:hypothetical protein
MQVLDKPLPTKAPRRRKIRLRRETISGHRRKVKLAA